MGTSENIVGTTPTTRSPTNLQKADQGGATESSFEQLTEFALCTSHKPAETVSARAQQHIQILERPAHSTPKRTVVEHRTVDPGALCGQLEDDDEAPSKEQEKASQLGPMQTGYQARNQPPQQLSGDPSDCVSPGPA